MVRGTDQLHIALCAILDLSLGNAVAILNILNNVGLILCAHGGR